MRNKNTVTLVLIILIIQLLVLTSCKRESKMLELLRNNTCELPCFYEISPGESTEEEVRNLIERVPGLENIFWNGAWNKYSNIAMADFSGSSSQMSIYFYQEIVYNIWISSRVHRGTLDIEITDLVSKLGDPKYVSVNGQNAGPGHVDRVYLLFPEESLIASYDKWPSNTITIFPNFYLNRLLLIDPKYYQSVQLTEDNDNKSTTFQRTTFFNWSGFVTYVKVIPTEQK